MDAWCIITVITCAFSSPEAAILLVSTKKRNSGSERLFKHNGLRPEPIRFGRLDSEHAQSDGKSVNRERPVLDLSRGKAQSILVPETALLLASTKNRDLWPGPNQEVRDSRNSHHSAHAQSQV